jgi:uncharacterized protein (TIGR03382 family)
MKSMIIIACVGAAVGVAQGQTYVMGVASTNDAVHLFDATTGALFQQNFIDLLAVGARTPKHALQVGNQIWVSDQLDDKIFRFDLSGSFIGEIGGALDNIKGMEVVGNQVWVTNAGSNNGATGNSIVFIDSTSYAITGSVATNGSLFDLINYNGQILAGNIGNESLEVYDLSGNLVSTFVSSDGISGIDFPQQLFVRGNGNVLAAGFSTPSGVFEYDVFGNSLGIVAGLDRGPRGVLELLNGDVMWTTGTGFFVGETEVLGGSSGQYLSFVVIPAPGAMALLGMGGLVAVRRRR